MEQLTDVLCQQNGEQIAKLGIGKWQQVREVCFGLPCCQSMHAQTRREEYAGAIVPGCEPQRFEDSEPE